MAQHDFNIANATFPSVRSDINSALTAINTTQSGTSRPASAVAGTIWLDTTTATTPTLKYYDGADDISLATLDHSANTVNWLDSTVSITGLSSTATGTVLTLTDSANTSTVNLIIDNQKEVRFRETTANGTNFIALKAPASVASDLTFTLPATDGASGQALVTNGSGVLSFASAGLAWQSVQTTGFTAVKGNAYPCDTTSSAFTVTLPATPSAGDQVQLVDYAGTFDTNALTIDRNGQNIEGDTYNVQLTGEREGVIFTYINATQGWIATSGINEGTDALSKINYSVDFLVVAGGGGGGKDTNNTRASGGGGAGGFRESTQTVNQGTVITVTVGDGGAAGGASPGTGSSGSDSSISGSGLTTITSAGGGGGGGVSSPGTGQAGVAGGSGGGAAHGGVQIGGAGNTPATSPSQGNNGGSGITSNVSAGGGGGGANAVGNNGSGTTGGAGGAGTANSITGSSITRAGGGGASGSATGGAGGTGGGGAGAGGAANGTNGTVNTGGGGGGSRGTPGNGGKGVVILSLPTALYSSTTTGSPTVTTSGANTILQFDGSGSYTA